MLLRNNTNPINPIEMIVTHPYLFNTIVILFIAFTAGWMVYVFTGRRAVHLKNKMLLLEEEKEQLRMQAEELEALLQKRGGGSVKTTPVISLSSAPKTGRINDAGV